MTAFDWAFVIGGSVAALLLWLALYLTGRSRDRNFAECMLDVHQLLLDDVKRQMEEKDERKEE